MAKRKANFTADTVDKYRCKSGVLQSLYWDAKTPGLGLRVTANGAKSFVFESRLNGKTIRVTIGDRKTYSIAQAQAEATALKAQIDRGLDPRLVRLELAAKAEEARAREEANRAERKRAEVTVGEAWARYVSEDGGSWGELHRRDHMQAMSPGGLPKKRGNGRTVSGVLFPLASLRLGDLSSEVVAAWLKTQATTRPTKAALGFRLLKAFIRWAEDTKDYKGLISPEAYMAKKVRKALPSQRAHSDTLQKEQLSAWFAEVRKIHNPVIATYLQALLLTGARRQEMLGLTWKDVDFKWRSLTIRDKVEGVRTIPLPPYLASLLSSLKRTNKWVFSSATSASGRLAEPRAAHVAALQNAGLPHVSIHGLRRTFSNLSEWVEMPAGITAQIMGHKPSAIAEKHYKSRPLDLLRRWHDKLESWALAEAGIKFDATVPQGSLRLVTSS